MPYFKKEIGRPGTYRVRDRISKKRRAVKLNAARLQRWANGHKEMVGKGLQIPAPFRHDPEAEPVRFDGDSQDVDSFNNGGWWKKVWWDDSVDNGPGKEKGRLYGRLFVPSEDDAAKIRDGRIRSVSPLAKPEWEDGDGNTFKDVMTHIGLVTHPVQSDQESFVVSSEKATEEQPAAIALSLGDYVISNNDSAGSRVNEEWFAVDEVGEGMELELDKVNASSMTVSKVIKMLGDLKPPIVLPADTNGGNFLERLTSALVQIHATQSKDEDNQITEPGKNSKEEPPPIAMALGDVEMKQDTAVTMLMGFVNPTTKAKFTKEEATAHLKATAEAEAAATPVVELSAENQAMVNWAKTQAKQGYKKRIQSLIQSRRVTAAHAKEHIIPLYESFDIQMSSDGQVLPNALDAVLAPIEALTKGSTLTGVTATQGKKQNKKVGLFSDSDEDEFSLDTITEEEPGFVLTHVDGDEFASDFDDEATDEGVEGILKEIGGNCHVDLSAPAL